MCGICGYISKNEKIREQDTIRRMCGTLLHRGPDEEGVWVKDNVALGMRRLKIIDLESGSQPIFNEDRSVTVVFNGEIYNFPELRAQLEKAGHRFYTQSDTEVIVHSYEEWGEQCVEHFNGMFAIALWDDRNKILLLARDRLGKKPLYYYHQPERIFVFGSEIKAILASALLRNIQPDYVSIHHYLSLQYVPDPMSGFAGIKKLPPASCLLWRDGEIKTWRYWELSYIPKTTNSEEELSEEIKLRLTESVRKRLISDVPLGVFLSGGIDSSIITALMAQLSDTPVKTFSIGFSEEEFSELPHARAVANKYNTEHHEFIVRYKETELLPKLIQYFDEPFADSSALPTYRVSEMTRQYVTVALNGDGGDETFAGYQRYRLDRLIRYYLLLPKFLRRNFIEKLFELLPEPTNIPIEKNWIAGLKRLKQVASISEKASILRWGSYFSDEMKRDLYTSDFLNLITDIYTEDVLVEWFDRAKANSLLDKTLFVDINTYLPGDLLVKADRMTMANSLEGRSPFLDYEWVEFVARLPEQFKLHGSVHKYLLKKTFGDLLPPMVRKRRKLGFGIPVGEWFRTSLKDMAFDILLSPTCINRGMFKKQKIEEILQEHLKRKTDHGKRIWTLIMLELWFQHYIDHKT
ncbi:asparagine synthase (glutamine-hydrolyzing) [Candidatus Sumerlaeota bacterium]|nr:asparagine synthase (glutamine-hydrolyzing) [Candidatus Sumerlaeota bacterium]